MRLVSLEDLQALVEAESLFAALRAKEHELPPIETTPRADVIGGNDLSTEVAYLQKVARYYVGSARRRSLAPDGPDFFEEGRSWAGGRP